MYYSVTVSISLSERSLITQGPSRAPSSALQLHLRETPDKPTLRF